MSDRKDTGGNKIESGWAGPGIEIWPEEDRPTHRPKALESC